MVIGIYVWCVGVCDLYCSCCVLSVYDVFVNVVFVVAIIVIWWLSCVMCSGCDV